MTDATTWLKPHQVQALRDACYDKSRYNTGARNDAIIALLYDAGLRPGELTGVTNEMFHPDEPSLRLPSSVQKQYPTDQSPPPVTIGLARDEYTSDTVRTVRQYQQATDRDSLYLFGTRQSDSLSTRQVRNIVKDAAVSADVRPHIEHEGQGDPSDVDPYTLRHSVAYRLLIATDGNTMYDVRNRLRHQSIQTTEENYDHFDMV